MNKSTDKKHILLLRNKLMDMPYFVKDFMEVEIKDRVAISTRLAYLKDIKLFCDYLMSLDKYSHIKEIAEFTVADMDLVTRADIQQFLSHLELHSVSFSNKSGNVVTQEFKNDKLGKSRKLSCLRTLFAYLYNKDNDCISQDVTQKVEISIEKKSRITNLLNPEESVRLLQTVFNGLGIESEHERKIYERTKLRDIAIIVTFISTGIRVSELSNLNLNDLNFVDMQFRVIRKGGDEAIIYMSDFVNKALFNYYNERINMKIDNSALFLSLQGNRITDRNIEYMIAKYAQRANITKNVTPHTLRRTFGTNLYEITEDIYLTADALGHNNVQTTKEHYAFLNESRIKKALVNFSPVPSDSLDVGNG